MKNIKKFTAIVLCLLLVITSFATVSAEESEFSGIVSKTVKVAENGDVEVLIDLAGNPGITAIKLNVYYDSNALTLKDEGFVDTGLLRGNVSTDLDFNPFSLGWNDSNNSIVEINYSNGTIAKLYFKMNEGFYGRTLINVDVEFTQTIDDYEFVAGPDMEDGVIAVTRNRLEINNGVLTAGSLNGETLIVASYDENGLFDCEIYPNSIGDKKITITNVINIRGAAKVKAFLWDNLETCTPVSDCAEVGL